MPRFERSRTLERLQTIINHIDASAPSSVKTEHKITRGHLRFFKGFHVKFAYTTSKHLEEIGDTTDSQALLGSSEN
ncbi:hypothetical protein OXX79_006557 [Metschnikowia pulcherrima]